MRQWFFRSTDNDHTGSTGPLKQWQRLNNHFDNSGCAYCWLTGLWGKASVMWYFSQCDSSKCPLWKESMRTHQQHWGKWMWPTGLQPSWSSWWMRMLFLWQQLEIFHSGEARSLVKEKKTRALINHVQWCSYVGQCYCKNSYDPLGIFACLQLQNAYGLDWPYGLIWSKHTLLTVA